MDAASLGTDMDTARVGIQGGDSRCVSTEDEAESVSAFTSLGCKAIARLVEGDFLAFLLVQENSLLWCIHQTDGVVATLCESCSQLDDAVADRSFVDGVVGIVLDGVELCRQCLLAHHLSCIMGCIVAHFCLRVDDDAGAVGSVFTGKRQVVNLACGVAGLHLGTCFLYVSCVSVVLASFSEEGNLCLVHRALNEEGFSWPEDIVVIHQRICLVGRVAHVPGGDRGAKVHESGVEIAWIWVADEVPAAVMRELRQIFLQFNLLVG